MQSKQRPGAQAVDVTGTPGGEALDGSADPDEMAGLEGNDRLYGHGGDDTLHGDEGDDTLLGGAGDDRLDGGSGDDTLFTGGGADTVVFRDGYDHDVVMDFDPSDDRVDLASNGIESWADVRARLSADDDGSAILRLDDGSTLRFDGVPPEDLGEANFVIAPPPVCFAAGTWIATPDGQARVETLRPGDLVMTLDAGAQPVLWVGRRWTRFGHGAHRHQPVRIAAGAMGGGLPWETLSLSPQHRVLLATGPRGALGKVRALCGRPGIAQDRTCAAADYLQLLLPRHAILFANGVAAESLYPGPVALASLPPGTRAEVEALFPGVGVDPARVYGPTARPILSARAVVALPAAALSGMIGPQAQLAAG